MSLREAKRLRVVEELANGSMRVAEAVRILNVSRRQVQRLKKSFLARGAAALVHGNRGRPAAHALTASIREQIASLLAREYKDASNAQAAELLARERQITVSAKSVGRIRNATGIANPHTHRRAKRYRSRRRMDQEGLMVQMDASPFDWLAGRGAPMSLHGGIDDARGIIVGLYFAPTECTLGYLQVLWQMATRHGLPVSVYTDRHTLFASPKQLTIEEELAGQTVALTQFGRALAELDIRHIKAHSPQAKGRIERLWQTLQERLTIEMRLANICTLQEANRFLEGYIARHNTRFAQQAADCRPAWQKAPPKHELANIIAERHTRRASRGSTFSFQGKIWHLRDDHASMLKLPYRAKVDMVVCLNGTTRALYNHRSYALVPFERQATSEKLYSEDTAGAPVRAHSQATEKTPTHKPAPDHPWRRYPNKTQQCVTFSQSQTPPTGGDIISVP